MSFFDNWLAFNECFDEGDFTALTQLVGYKILAIDNERKHPESFLLTDRELMNRTGIKSGQTIVEARRRLKNAGLIDFKTAKNKPTRYSIKHQSSTNDQSIKHGASTNQARALVSYTQNLKEEEEKENNYDGAGANTSELEEILEYWERDLRGGRLIFEHQAEIAVWLSKKGLHWLKDAMKTAAESNNNPRGMSFKYLKAVISNKLKLETAATPKGGEKSGTDNEKGYAVDPVTGYKYTLPDTSKDPDLSKYKDWDIE